MSRRIFKSGIPCRAVAQRRRLDEAARSSPEPGAPCRPPRTVPWHMLVEPGIGVDVGRASFSRLHAKMTMRVTGFREYPGVMSTICQDKSNFGLGEEAELEHRPPRRHMVALGADHEYRRTDVQQHDRSILDREPTLGEVIVEKQ